MLKNKNIQLKLLEEEDLYLIVKWRNNSYEHFYEYPFSNCGQKLWFEKYLKNDDLLFMIYEINKDNIIGMVSLYDIDKRNMNAKFGRFFIDKNFREKGYGKETVVIVLDYAFKHLNLHRVYLDTLKSNIKVISLYIKVGFKQEGIKKDHIYKNGNYNDLVSMGILKKDYI